MDTKYCGTRTGYNRHYSAKETPCNPCKDAHRTYYQNWRKKNPETVKRMHEEYSASHKDRIAETSKTWAVNNPDRIKEIQKKYRQANPEKIRNKTRARRARRRLNGYEPYTEHELFTLYGYNCHLCNELIDLEAPRRNNQKGWELGLHVDHVIPISKGGTDTLDNVRPAHGGCNLKRGVSSSLL